MKMEYVTDYFEEEDTDLVDPQQEAEEELIRQQEYYAYAKASVESDAIEKELRC